jgi:hypothetical protein
MIIYVATAEHQYTVRELLENRVTLLDGRFILLSYAELLSWNKMPVGHYVFTDFDRLPADQRQLVLTRVAALRAVLPAHAKILNHPVQTLGRLALLDALQSAGINDYRAKRVALGFAELNFPLFLRFENDHAGAQTPLLMSLSELRQALDSLEARGVDVGQCLLIEYIDVKNTAGLFEKFSIFRVGDSYFSAEHSVHSDWICKGNAGELWSPEWGEKELEFQSSNPHLELLKPVFEMAGIQYGRVDYAFSKGRVQVFEINTNPMLDVAAESEPLRQRAQAHFIDSYVKSCLALSSTCLAAGFVTMPDSIGAELFEAQSRRRSELRRLLHAAGLLKFECIIFRWLRRLLRR